MVVNGSVSSVGRRISGSINNLISVEGCVERAENIYVKETEFNNRYEFPSIGKPNMIYVAKDEHKIYMFNANTLTYEVIGSDYNEIEIIQGKL